MFEKLKEPEFAPFMDLFWNASELCYNILKQKDIDDIGMRNQKDKFFEELQPDVFKSMLRDILTHDKVKTFTNNPYDLMSSKFHIRNVHLPTIMGEEHLSAGLKSYKNFNKKNNNDIPEPTPIFYKKVCLALIFLIIISGI